MGLETPLQGLSEEPFIWTFGTIVPRLCERMMISPGNKIKQELCRSKAHRAFVTSSCKQRGFDQEAKIPCFTTLRCFFVLLVLVSINLWDFIDASLNSVACT